MTDFEFRVMFKKKIVVVAAVVVYSGNQVGDLDARMSLLLLFTAVIRWETWVH